MKYTSPLMKEILQSPKAQKIIDYVSPIYEDAYIGLWIFEVIGRELDWMAHYCVEYGYQVVPNTATWALKYYEQMYGIQTDESLPLEIRRANILSRTQDRAPLNPKKLAKIASLAANNAPVEVIEITGKHRFILSVTDIYDKKLIKTVRSVVDERKPAHLYYDFEVKSACRIENQNQFIPYRMWFNARAVNYDMSETIILNGDHDLDGTWLLNQFFEAHFGLRIFTINFGIKNRVGAASSSSGDTGGLTFKYSAALCWEKEAAARHRHRAEIKNRNGIKPVEMTIRTSIKTTKPPRVYLTSDSMWYLDGLTLLDGSKRLNARYEREEL